MRHVTIRDGSSGLPYSKGVMATSVMAAGVAPSQAFAVAEIIEQRLRERSADSVTQSELIELAAAVIEERCGAPSAENYRRWQRARHRTVPLIVVIGGGTGVGKSTVATTLANRLGIVRIVSTDAVREVMRGIFTAEMMPTLFASSYDVASRLPESTDTGDPVITGFDQQVRAVSVGVARVLHRAVVEGTDLIVEGVHAIPGFLELPQAAQAIVAPMVITVDDEDTHRSHFLARGQETRSNRDLKYLKHFDAIRKVQEHVRALALAHQVPVVSSYDLDTTVSQVMEKVVSAITKPPAVITAEDRSRFDHAASAASLQE